MRTCMSCFMLILALAMGGSQEAQCQDYTSYRSPQDWVIAKNYLATFLLYQDSALTERILAAPEFQQILSSWHDRYLSSLACQDVPCFLDAFKWRDDEIDALVALFARHSMEDDALKEKFDSRLLPSQAYGLSEHTTAMRYIEKALRQDLNAMNYTIDVYAGGKRPNYPLIDSIAFDITKKSFLALLLDVRQDVLKDIRQPHHVFYETLLTAVRLLEVNERWDAAQLEPLIALENKKAFEAIKTTNFDNYPYPLLLTLGAGPAVYHQPISPGGMLRARMAARSYFEGLAPFIVVSGGRVHPYKTPYIEAVEMKKYLMETLSVPEEAILIEPHARHTTTNLRNTARIMLTYGFPADRFAIVTSSVPHIDAVEKMEDRCINELGYVPYELGRRVSDVIIEFKPRLEALTIDPDEPLDP
ncbi:YdcF family protein [Parapedobacter sp. ISTM3]|uniref:YdcF family protein n=1 Tax=Parapedobacter sp. ISTM3 TaxID=2800130 RepID=UPI001903CECF|nr:YdcF family protein [Parapedobacter sp. ISTM3]MBK1441392.1 YdcF family protein [Parapedobacter sp. ISTM3]